MHILISNDDGIHAAGIRAVAEGFAANGHVVTVSAPDRERSASGHALTMRDPLYAQRVTGYSQGIDAWAVTGTPVDCVRIGLTTLASTPVDLVVSGINHGPNMGSDTIYSGTVAAAMEAVLLGYPALAVSVCTKGDLKAMPVAVKWACRVADQMKEFGLDAKRVYNLNVPALPDAQIKGLRIATLGHRCYENGYEKRTSPIGREHYWLSSRLEEIDQSPGCDQMLTRSGYVTLTPLTWSMMDQAALPALKAFEGGI